jgi:hypothetical protein
MSAKANPPTCPCLLQGWHHYNNVHYPRPCWRAAIIHWSHVTVNSSSAICHSPGSEQALMAELYLEHWKGSIEPYWGLKPFGYGSKHVKTLAAWFSHQISWRMFLRNVLIHGFWSIPMCFPMALHQYMDSQGLSGLPTCCWSPRHVKSLGATSARVIESKRLRAPCHWPPLAKAPCSNPMAVCFKTGSYQMPKPPTRFVCTFLASQCKVVRVQSLYHSGFRMRCAFYMHHKLLP